MVTLTLTKLEVGESTNRYGHMVPAVMNSQTKDDIAVVETGTDEEDRAYTLLFSMAPQLLMILRSVAHHIRDGYCYCDYGIGHPSFNSHAPVCRAARAVLEQLKEIA